MDRVALGIARQGYASRSPARPAVASRPAAACRPTPPGRPARTGRGRAAEIGSGRDGRAGSGRHWGCRAGGDGRAGRRARRVALTGDARGRHDPLRGQPDPARARRADSRSDPDAVGPPRDRVRSRRLGRAAGRADGQVGRRVRQAPVRPLRRRPDAPLASADDGVVERLRGRRAVAAGPPPGVAGDRAGGTSSSSSTGRCSSWSGIRGPAWTSSSPAWVRTCSATSSTRQRLRRPPARGRPDTADRRRPARPADAGGDRQHLEGRVVLRSPDWIRGGRPGGRPTPRHWRRSASPANGWPSRRGTASRPGRGRSTVGGARRVRGVAGRSPAPGRASRTATRSGARVVRRDQAGGGRPAAWGAGRRVARAASGGGDAAGRPQGGRRDRRREHARELRRGGGGRGRDDRVRRAERADRRVGRALPGPRLRPPSGERDADLADGLEHLARAEFDGVLLDVDLKLEGYELRTIDAVRAAGLLERSLFSTTYPGSLSRIRRPRRRSAWAGRCRACDETGRPIHGPGCSR